VKGDPKIVEFLNTVLRNELTAINQYFLHARLLRHWGVTRFAEKEYKESIEEMHHAEWVIDRILFLDGHPNLQVLNQLRIGEKPEEVLACDLAVEEKALADLREAIAHAESVRDFVSRDLFAKILENEEEHVDFIESQQDLIRLTGVQNWIQLNSAPTNDAEDDGK
jgi:bacterioferritin